MRTGRHPCARGACDSLAEVPSNTMPGGRMGRARSVRCNRQPNGDVRSQEGSGKVCTERPRKGCLRACSSTRGHHAASLYKRLRYGIGRAGPDAMKGRRPMPDRPEKKLPRTLRLNARDNIIVAVDSVDPGTSKDGVTATARILRGHKMAAQPIAKGQPVLKFGQIIGFATEDIVPGAHVHTHNCSFAEFERDHAFAEESREEPLLPSEARATFEGFRRANGKAGTRNYLGILTSVNCSASVARFIAEAVNRAGVLDQYPNVDGVVSFVHGTGCGLAGSGEGYEALERTQWGYAGHPNLAAALVVALGCEVFQIERLKTKDGLMEGANFRTMTIQDTGGTRRTIEAGVARIREMLPRANQARRETVPVSELMLALQCGGSDGYSGITANPALGAAVDTLVRHGGTAVLSETPEIYGAEHLLTRLARNAQVGQKLVDIIHWWQEYCARNNGSMDNNPSPGNRSEE